MIKLLITFDYELPLGKAKSYSKGLFSPAKQIIDLGKELDTPFIFFADICSLIMFKNWDYENYYLPFKAQLQDAILKNHDIQLHIHPHWLTSNYNNGTFEPSDDYSLGKFDTIAGFTIEDIIKDGIKELNSICKEVKEDYNCIAYRAGGYSIEDNYTKIIEALKRNDILIDSSILPGYFHKDNYRNITFKSNLSNSWNLDAVDLYKEGNTGILEIPISNMPVTLSYLFHRRWRKIVNKEAIKNNRYRNEGVGLTNTNSKFTVTEQIKQAFNPVSLSFDNYHVTVGDLEKIVDFNIKKHKTKDPIYITTISHPKAFGDFNLKLLKDFILRMKEKYSDQIEIITYKQLFHS